MDEMSFRKSIRFNSISADIGSSSMSEMSGVTSVSVGAAATLGNGTLITGLTGFTVSWVWDGTTTCGVAVAIGLTSLMLNDGGTLGGGTGLQAANSARTFGGWLLSNEFKSMLFVVGADGAAAGAGLDDEGLEGLIC